MVKNKLRLLGVIIPIMLVLLLGICCLLHFSFSGGWVEKDGAKQYLSFWGTPKLQWQTIDEKVYYFYPDSGDMAIGWQNIDGTDYYFGNDGARVSGWLKQEDKTFYLDIDGKRVSDWQTIDGQTYHFAEDGTLTREWFASDGKRYFFAEDGALTTGWLAWEEKNYYFAEDGVLATGWLELDGKRYYLGEDGVLTTGWLVLDTNRYYCKEDGALVTGWQDLDGNRYFFSEQGCATVGWYTENAKTYYFNATGEMHIGWLTLDKDRYYFKHDGTMAIGEVKIDGVSNFFTSKGKYVLMTNPWHAIPKDFKLDLVKIGNFKFDRSGRDALQSLLDDCNKAGYSCYINNTYRTHGSQQYLWDNGIAKRMAKGMTYEQALADTKRSVMIPGHSEHETGLAVDISRNDGVYDWLDKYCWDYGFIVRYPDDSVAITGIKYEPWHLRYVGTELALELKELGLCMEEYMDMLTKQQANL